MEPYFWPMVLLLAGVVVIGIEMFVPSGGVLGVIAALCFFGAIVVGYLHSMRTGTVMLLVTSAVVPLVIAAAIQIWPKTALGKKILVPLPESPDEVLPDTEEYRGLKQLIGRRGHAKCEMLPGGTVEIEHRSYDAISPGMPIGAGTTVEVIDIRVNRLVVRACDPDHQSPNGPRASNDSDDLLTRPIESLGIEDPLA